LDTRRGGAPERGSEWEGKSQRAIDGEVHEVHEVHNWGTPVDTLRSMLAAT